MSITLGLDLGIASVGAALVEDNKKLIYVGVRAFDAAEVPKTGESLNLIRRSMRLNRRRLFRKSFRLQKLVEFLIKNSFIHSASLIASLSPCPPEAIRTVSGFSSRYSTAAAIGA